MPVGAILLLVGARVRASHLSVRSRRLSAQGCKLAARRCDPANASVRGRRFDALKVRSILMTTRQPE